MAGPSQPRGTRTRRLVAYALMIGATVAVYLVIRSAGERLVAPAPGAGPGFGRAGGQSAADTLLHVLLALAVVIMTARALGTLFRKLHQPPVIGEIIAGILLGPSLLGRIWRDASAFLLPTSVAPFLGMISQLGVILYMFL